MIILFPLGGTGERFKVAGYVTPKPLIELNGRPLLQHVLDCYPERLAGQLSYVYALRYDMLEPVREMSPRHMSEFYQVSKPTRGPVETILSNTALISALSCRRELLIADCDSLIAASELEDALRMFRSTDAIGGVLIRRTDDPACSYATLTDRNLVTQTAEKKVISDWSTTGPYWWRDARDFLRCALIMAAKGEYHISPCYNQLIEEGRKVRAFRTLTFRHLGTPEALESYAADANMKVCK